MFYRYMPLAITAIVSAAELLELFCTLNAEDRATLLHMASVQAGDMIPDRTYKARLKRWAASRPQPQVCKCRDKAKQC
jgi:hypothetical protein